MSNNEEIKKIIFGYASMIITIILSLTLPQYIKFNEFTAILCAFIAVFNCVLSGIIIVRQHVKLGNLPNT